MHPTFHFGTKAETLARLAGHVRGADVLPLAHCTVEAWRSDRTAVVAGARALGARRYAVRSSACGEDGATASLAGRYASVLDVAPEGLAGAIEAVVASYGHARANDQVLLQPMLEGVLASGVAFSRDPSTGAPYTIINIASGADTTAVTAGRTNDLQTVVAWRGAADRLPPRERSVARLVDELIALTGEDRLDLEFAFIAGPDGEERLVLLQLRPLAACTDAAPLPDHEKHLASIAEKIRRGMAPHPYLHGRRTVYGVMPDWNPAEIIGIRPRPLALSLYAEMVTDAVWAYQRNNYGYKNLRSFPLMVSFHGLPYIDVRVSFNSFIPRDVDGELAERLANYYIDRLLALPALHDKVEFEIIFSCYTLDLADRLDDLRAKGFSADECRRLSDSLRALTNRIINGQTGLWRSDAAKIDQLERRHAELLRADLDPVSRIYWILEDCKRYGTLPFAGLARAGFIAVQLLRSLVRVGVLSQEDAGRFMNGLDTVSARLGRDLAQLGRTGFLARYGHLRPGTYDILSPRYDEAPDRYFDWSRPPAEHKAEAALFALSLDQMRDISRLLGEHGLAHDIVGLFDFLKGGIEGREYAKFVFTRSLSDALSLFRELGERHGFDAEAMSYADIHVIHDLYTSSADPRELIGASIERGRQAYERTRQILLPPLITSPDDVFAFAMPPSEPNYITQRAASGPVRSHRERDGLEGAIVMIPSADPGFDWIFAHRIAGFVTAYGGANSHMAIRAGELGLPAVIGAGETLFARWTAAEMLQLDCANRQVTVLR
jgi:glutamine kinase